MNSVANRLATVGTIAFALALFLAVEAVTLLENRSMGYRVAAGPGIGASGVTIDRNGNERFGGPLPKIIEGLPVPPPAAPSTKPERRGKDQHGALRLQPGPVVGVFGFDGGAMLSAAPLPLPPSPSRWRRALGFALPLLAALAMVVAFWFVLRFLAKDSLRPLDGIAEALRALADGEHPTRTVAAGSTAELAGVAAAYNAAATRVSDVMDERVRTQERMRQFVADAGHELRTPLTVISGYIDVLRRGAIAERSVADEILTTMSFEKEHMRALIDRLLRLSRLDAEAPPQIGVVELEPLLRSHATTAQHLDPHREISYAIEGRPTALADRDELSEAIWNLVENALKYAPGAPVTITARETDDTAVIEVTDGGPGMTDSERSQAFQRFFRGDARGDVPGSGLGLAIAKRSVERSHGTIELKSTPGIGTTVTITLPTASSAAKAAP